MKLGHRVTIQNLPQNHPLKNLEGKRGEIDAINGNLYLVDGQLVNGVRQGKQEMREWIEEQYLELG